MFKVEYLNEVFTVYSVRYDNDNKATYFMIHDNGIWEWIDSYHTTPYEKTEK